MTVPKPLPELTPEIWRRQLAGLVDPANRVSSTAEVHASRDDAAEFVRILAQLFGLKRNTLWKKIESAIRSGIAKSPPGDVEQFAASCLHSVKARAGAVASSSELALWLADCATPTSGKGSDVAYRQNLMHLFHSKLSILLVWGRKRHQEWLQANRKTEEQLEVETINEEEVAEAIPVAEGGAA